MECERCSPSGKRTFAGNRFPRSFANGGASPHRCILDLVPCSRDESGSAEVGFESTLEHEDHIAVRPYRRYSGASEHSVTAVSYPDDRHAAHHAGGVECCMQRSFVCGV
jgi:hypothetical protein